MATVTGLTADRMLAIEAASVVDGDVIGDNLILTKHDGSTINAGSVRGPKGDQGPIGQDTVVLSAVPILDVGLLNQIRAGRQLTATDFTNMGLSAPAGLWNLSDLADSSGNGRSLLNKGGVPFASGINGLANTASQFVGSAGQALYIPDTGAADPFRIKTGTFGCWYRTDYRGKWQSVMSKWGASPQQGWLLQVASNGIVQAVISGTGSDSGTIQGAIDTSDDRWHFVVITFDGTMIRIYVDGALDNAATWGSPIFGASAAVNIGGNGADGSAATQNQFWGRIDEAFVTPDVLTEDQIRYLYCAKIAHTLGVAPIRASLSVRRRRKGAALVPSDFPTQPVRLHNFSAGSLGDEGSGNVPLVNNSGAVPEAGADGTAGNGFGFLGSPQSLSSTDVGLPSGLGALSFGAWFKTYWVSSTTIVICAYGSPGMSVNINQGFINESNAGDNITGPFVADSQWHHIVVVHDPTAADGIKRKMYIDGKLVANTLTLNSITAAGANRFRIGAASDGTLSFVGTIDGVFMCNYALTFEQIVALFVKTTQGLAPSPKNVGDHVEALHAGNLLVTFDTLDIASQIDLGVA